MRLSTLIALLVAYSVAAPAKDDLKLEDLWPKKSFFGKIARSMEWSYDDRYVGYLWNPYDDKGSDIWLYDLKSGKSSRLTSIEMMAQFDKELPAVIEKYKKDKEEEERRKKLTDEERKKLEEEDDKKEQTPQEGLRDYPGISAYEWSNKSHQMLFEYRGDIFRLRVGDKTPTQLTKTQDAETGVQFTKDDLGFYFTRSSGVYRMRFDSPMVEQLNPKLPKSLGMWGYELSPDESKILITSGVAGKDARQISYISYRERFAQAKTAPRTVADDPFTDEQYLFIYNLKSDKDEKAWEICHLPPSDDWSTTSVSDEPWSPDSKKVTFATWKRGTRELEFFVADTERKRVDSAYKVIHDGGQNSPGMADPFFMADSARIIALLENSGYRHAWIIDPFMRKATQLTTGDFEVYPRKLSKDGRTLYATSWKEHSSRNDVYAVNTESGAMQRLTTGDGTYSTPVFSHDFKKFGITFKNWTTLEEMVVCNGTQTQVTKSHPDTFFKVHRLTPQLFEFKNRHGQPIRGMLYLPPDYKRGDQRPLLIYTYGGPLGTTKDVQNGNFNRFNMYMAYKHGYIAATIDPRGMSGYGAAFEAANWQAPGVAQVEDLSDGAKYLIDSYGADKERVGIYGWSFGGFQTQMCMYTAPETFKLGIAGAGPTEWQNYNNWYSGGVIGKSRIGKPEDLDKYSLTKLAKNLKGPLMLLHGMEDTNVLFQDTVKVYQALLKAGKGPLVDLVLDPTGGHGLGGDIKPKDQYAIYEAFLLRNWGTFHPAAGGN